MKRELENYFTTIANDVKLYRKGHCTLNSELSLNQALVSTLTGANSTHNCYLCFNRINAVEIIEIERNNKKRYYHLDCLEKCLEKDRVEKDLIKAIKKAKVEILDERKELAKREEFAELQFKYLIATGKVIYLGGHN